MTDILLAIDAIPCRLIAGLVTGAILGSFATMLSYRLPRGLSILWPGSHCPACKTPLRPRDLVPFLSFAARRGKCRYCGIFIGWRYFVTETVMALSGAAVFVIFGFTLWLLVALAVILAGVTLIAVLMERASA
jgi:prepilin signal peptidase PulO-like enzyme (type II secretory pathway)